MNPKLFLVQKQQAQMKAELAARRQYELQQEAQYAASCVPTVSVQVLTKVITYKSPEDAHQSNSAAADTPFGATESTRAELSLALVKSSAWHIGYVCSSTLHTVVRCSALPELPLLHHAKLD